MAAILMGVGLGAAVLGQTVSAVRAGRSAESQAKSQKKAANRYAKALRSQASKLQGGMSAARQNTLKAGAALDRAALGQQARDEAKRGGQSPSVALEAELDASLQASMAQQQQMIDQMSQQEAVAKDAQRQALRGQALQTEMQAQAINPEAIRKGATAPVFGQIGSTLASAGMQVAAPTVSQQVQAGSLKKQLAPIAGVDFNATGFNPGSLTGAGQKAAYATYMQSIRPPNPYGPTR